MLTKGNVGNIYRHEDVNIQPCTDEGGGYELTSIYGGEWLEYTVNVETEGDYDLFLRAACAEENASFHISFREENLTGTVAIPNTGSVADWTTVRINRIHLTKGEQVIQLAIDTGIVNLNYLELKVSE